MREHRSRPWLDLVLAALVGAALLLAAGWLVPPAAAPFPGHGARFAAMVEAPFGFTGEFPHRVLWPLLAHLAGWLGLGPVAASQAASGALLAVVFWFARRRGLAALDAGLVAAAIAASGALLVYQPMACFSDPLNLLLLVLQLHFAARPAVFWPLVLLAALSHELALFFAPWLLWLRTRHGGSWWRDGAWLAAVTGLYGGWRMYVSTHGSGSYGFSYYFENMIWVPWGLPLLWSLWGLVVLVEFGPLLVTVVRGFRRDELELGGRRGALLYVACLLPLMVLAYDVMRFATFWLLPVLTGVIALLRGKHGRPLFLGILLAAIACYRWQHPEPSQQGGAAFTRLSGEILALLPSHYPLTFDKGVSLSGELLRRGADIWWAALAAVVVIVGLGLALARYTGSASSPGSAPRTRG
ncbi:MAG: hypothetical protein MUC36_09910 [Planctomycetes bacterium]|jgi:hypothetical protein|nr:hypothetical protein [Planctomycetota bacterium]